MTEEELVPGQMLLTYFCDGRDDPSMRLVLSCPTKLQHRDGSDCQGQGCHHLRVKVWSFDTGNTFSLSVPYVLATYSVVGADDKQNNVSQENK
jgi:hypothetical protein